MPRTLKILAWTIGVLLVRDSPEQSRHPRYFAQGGTPQRHAIPRNQSRQIAGSKVQPLTKRLACLALGIDSPVGDMIPVQKVIQQMAVA